MKATAVRDDIRPVLTGRLVALAAGLSIVVYLTPVEPPWGLVIVNGALLLAALGDYLMTVKPSKIEVERELPATIAMNAEGTITWRVRNPRNRRTVVRIADELVPSLGAERRRSTLSLPPRGRVSASVAIRPERRGRFDINDLTVRVLGPLGLVARQGTQSLADYLRVYPTFHSKKQAELRVQRARVSEVGLRSVRGLGAGTEFEQLREYGPDDDFRRIDWAATARSGKPIVRTYRPEQNQNVMVLLDTGRVMAGRVLDVPRLEHGMDAVMALATVAGRLGDRVGMMAFDKGVRAEIASAPGKGQLAKVTEAMYELQPRLVESDYRGAFVHMLSRSRRRSLVVIITEVGGQSLADTLFPALPLLVRKHLVVVAGVRDPDVDRWANAVPTESGTAFRKTAAVLALDDRSRIVAELTRRGAVVVDAVPGKLAAELADNYLRAKATGRL